MYTPWESGPPASSCQYWERKDVLMIQFKSDQGEISVSSAVFSNITGIAATNCFGVKGMAYRSMTDGLVHLLRREAKIGRASCRERV